MKIPSIISNGQLKPIKNANNQIIAIPTNTKNDGNHNLYEVRTRKILLISNAIASTSTIINAAVTSNPKNLDIGSLLNTVTHLFTDIRFIARIKQEFIENEISDLKCNCKY